MVDVSVLIVTWNSSGEIKECMESVIRNSQDLSVEIVVVDNNSEDDTFEKVNRVNYNNLHSYKNNSNLGFTKAVNQAVRYSTGRNLLLLNPDTVLREGVIDSLAKFLDGNPAYGACAPVMLNPDGTIQQSVRSFPDYWKMLCEFSLLAYIFPRTKLFGSWKMRYLGYDRDEDIDQPMAAALMIRREIVNPECIMDERFEMFFNDVDLCKQIIDSGKKIRLLTETKVVHMHGASIKKVRVNMIRAWNRDCTRYFGKHHPNFVLLLWLKINLKISEIIRVAYYEIRH
jgi:GT2 family glycosyltransferase